MQSQKFKRKQQQTQMIADRQTFKEQVNNTFTSIILPAKMSQNPSINEETVNTMTDGAILALDMLIVSCNEFRKQSDKDSINLCKKTVYDKWNELKKTDQKTYQLTKKYRDFIIAALNGQNNKRYNSYRVDTSQPQLFQHDAQTICNSYGRVIHNNSEFDKQQQSYLRPHKNKQLQLQQEAELNEYHKNKKFYDKTSKYSRPNQSKLYFTKSGKNGTFQHVNAENDEKSMMDEIMGGVDSEYKKIPFDFVYHNVLVKDPKNKLFPAQILYPDNWKKMEKIVIRAAHPHNTQTYEVDIECIDFNINNIKKEEAQHKKNYGKLGYKSIIDQEKEKEAAMQVDSD